MEWILLWQVVGALVGAGVGAWIGGYFKESGRRRAIAAQLDGIRAEVRAVTNEAETIKAEIQGGLWERQWLLNQKRDTYARVIESMTELESQLTVFSQVIKRPPSESAAEQAHRAAERAEIVGHEMERGMALARIFLCREAMDAVAECIATLKRKPANLEYAELCQSLDRAAEKLVLAARRELGTSEASAAAVAN